MAVEGRVFRLAHDVFARQIIAALLQHLHHGLCGRVTINFDRSAASPAGKSDFIQAK